MKYKYHFIVQKCFTQALEIKRKKTTGTKKGLIARKVNQRLCQAWHSGSCFLFVGKMPMVKVKFCRINKHGDCKQDSIYYKSGHVMNWKHLFHHPMYSFFAVIPNWYQAISHTLILLYMYLYPVPSSMPTVRAQEGHCQRCFLLACSTLFFYNLPLFLTPFQCSENHL